LKKITLTQKESFFDYTNFLFNCQVNYYILTFQKQAPKGGERTDDEADEADVRDEAAPGEGARGDHHPTQELTGFAIFRTQILLQKWGLCNI
jgi:hypothetical protein